MKKLLFSTAFFGLLAIVSCNKDQDQPGDDGGSKDDDKKTFTDTRDNQTYEYVEIGTQTWMAENLNYDVDNDATKDSSSCYDDDMDNCDEHGKLYTHEAAKIACPSGWHLPTDEEWKTLEKNQGMSETDANGTSYRGEIVGKLIEGGSSGLDLTYSGYYSNNNLDYSSNGYGGLYWTATYSSGDTDAFFRAASSGEADGFERNSWSVENKLSVRCIMD